MSDRHAATTQEPFVSAQEAADFLAIKRRLLLSLARKGIGGAYPIGTGDSRRQWIFRLSELGTAIDDRNTRGVADKRGYDPISKGGSR